ncbi:MAG: hypothetical protein GY711_18345 [bacterium]|nr:hypothetical protein [bacterium]
MIRFLPAFVCIVPATAQWSTEQLSEPRSALAATSVGQYALFGGGANGGAPNASATVDIYDAAAESWATSSLSIARHSLVATSAGSKALFAGGGPQTALVDRVDIWDATTGLWTVGTLSLAREDFAAATAGTQALFAGGTAGANVPEGLVDIYDAATGTWTTSTMATPRIRLAATGIGDIALFTGGTYTNATVDIYDSSTGSWRVGQMSLARFDLTATTVGTKALFAGGSTGSITDVVDIYDAETATWSTATLSVPRRNMVAASAGRYALFVGGHEQQVYTSDVVDIYDSATDTWSVSTLPVARHFMAATGVGDKVMIGGGQFATRLSVVDVFDAGPGVPFCGPAVPNSSGNSARIFATGSPFVLQSDLTLTADRLPAGEFGYFLVGSNSGQFQPPGSDGILCLACGFQGCTGIGRYNQAGNIIQGPSGSIPIDLTALPLSPTQAVLPGDTWNFQCWFRDVGSSNFTNAVSVTFL